MLSSFGYQAIIHRDDGWQSITPYDTIILSHCICFLLSRQIIPGVDEFNTLTAECVNETVFTFWTGPWQTCFDGSSLRLNLNAMITKQRVIKIAPLIMCYMHIVCVWFILLYMQHPLWWQVISAYKCRPSLRKLRHKNNKNGVSDI